MYIMYENYNANKTYQQFDLKLTWSVFANGLSCAVGKGEREKKIVMEKNKRSFARGHRMCASKYSSVREIYETPLKIYFSKFLGS